MTKEQAEEETAKLFIRFARDRAVRTVLWVVQWRLGRFFSQIVTHGHEPDMAKSARLCILARDEG